MGMAINDRDKMAKRAAKEIKDGMLVNLGIGIPSLVPNHLPKNLQVMFHAENGIVGIGPAPMKGSEDANLCNAGGFPVTVVEGASYFDSTIAFGMIRRGKVDISILGALQVSQNGDLANWIVPGKKVPGMGGAIELAEKAKRVIVLMNHQDKYGASKIVESCTLPLTSAKCVDLIITEKAVFTVHENGLTLIECFYPYSIEEITQTTDCDFSISKDVKMIAKEEKN